MQIIGSYLVVSFDEMYINRIIACEIKTQKGGGRMCCLKLSLKKINSHLTNNVTKIRDHRR